MDKKNRKFANIFDTPGSPFSKDFYLLHRKKIFVLLIVVPIYINMRYECEEAIARIDKLKKELADVRYTNIAKWGELTGLNKPEIIRNKISNGSNNLQTSDEPFIVIKK